MSEDDEGTQYFQVEAFNIEQIVLRENETRQPLRKVNIKLYGERKGNIVTQQLCMSVLLWSDGMLGIDGSDTVRWSKDSWATWGRFESEEYQGVPGAVLMEMFLLLFEYEGEPNTDYTSQKYYRSNR